MNSHVRRLAASDALKRVDRWCGIVWSNDFENRPYLSGSLASHAMAFERFCFDDLAQYIVYLAARGKIANDLGKGSLEIRNSSVPKGLESSQ